MHCHSHRYYIHKKPIPDRQEILVNMTLLISSCSATGDNRKESIDKEILPPEAVNTHSNDSSVFRTNYRSDLGTKEIKDLMAN